MVLSSLGPDLFLSWAIEHVNSDLHGSGTLSSVLLLHLRVQIVVDHDDFLGAVGISLKHTLDASVGSPSLATWDVPGVSDHKLEVVISLDAHRDVVVVFNELVLVDSVVLDTTGMVSVVSLEGIEEFAENLVLSLLTRLDIGVLLGVESLTDIVDVNDTTVVSVHNIKGLHNKILSELVHTTADTSKELVIVDGTRTISVEHGEEFGSLLLGDTNSEVMASLLEFFNVERLRTIIISDSELTANTHDTAGTTSSKLLSEDVHELSLRVVHGRSVILGLGRGSILLLLLLSSVSQLGLVTETTLGALGVVVRPSLLGNSLTIEVPGRVHHSGEVVISVNGGTDVVVVFLPFFFGNNVIRGRVVSQVMGSLESFKEFLEDLLLSLLAGLDVGVELGVVNILDVIVVKVSVTILVHDTESLINKLLSVGVHGSTDISKEFIVLNKTRVIIVHVVEQGLDLTLRETEHVVLHGLSKLILVKGHGVVVVHDAELLGETNDSTSTTGSQLLAKLIKKSFGTVVGRLGRRGTTNITTEDLRSELTVVNGTIMRLVIDVEKGIQVLFCGDHDTNLLDGFSELIGLDTT